MIAVRIVDIKGKAEIIIICRQLPFLVTSLALLLLTYDLLEE